MGCSISRQNKTKQSATEVSSGVVYNKDAAVYYGDDSSEGIQVSSAAWRADENSGDYVKIVEGKDSLFACLFDAHGTPDAAAFCSSRCGDVFEKSMKESEGNPRRALETTFEVLNRLFLTSKRKTTTNHFSGCSGVIVYLDFSDNKGWIANVGTSQGLVGVSEGAFNAKYMDGQPLVDRHIHGCQLEERLEASNRCMNDVTAAQVQPINCIGYLNDSNVATACNKEIKHLATGSLSCKPQVVAFDLSKQTEQLVLYSEGIGQLLSPSEMGVFAMHFDAFHLKTAVETSGIMGDGSERSPASMLVRRAVSKAAEKYSRAMSVFEQSSNRKTKSKGLRSRLINVEDMRRLKLNVSDRSTPAPSEPINRKDLHGNLSCIVISLDQDNRTMPTMQRSTGRPSKAVDRWKRVRLLCKFHIQKRRTVLRHWWNLISLAVSDAQLQILEAEKAEWKKLSRSSMPAAVDRSQDEKENISTLPSFCSTRSKFRKWLDAPSSKRSRWNDGSLSTRSLCL